MKSVKLSFKAVRIINDLNKMKNPNLSILIANRLAEKSLSVTEAISLVNDISESVNECLKMGVLSYRSMTGTVVNLIGPISEPETNYDFLEVPVPTKSDIGQKSDAHTIKDKVQALSEKLAQMSGGLYDNSEMLSKVRNLINQVPFGGASYLNLKDMIERLTSSAPKNESAFPPGSYFRNSTPFDGKIPEKEKPEPKFETLSPEKRITIFAKLFTELSVNTSGKVKHPGLRVIESTSPDAFGKTIIEFTIFSKDGWHADFKREWTTPEHPCYTYYQHKNDGFKEAPDAQKLLEHLKKIAQAF